jgi:nitrogen regulatory protein P-II 1
MKYKKIVAIIRKGHLEKVEQALIKHGVKGVTVTQVKGFGGYINYFSRDWMCEHTRIELFVNEDEVDSIVDKLIEAAYTGASGDGMVAVLPVETVYRIRTKQPATIDEV